MARSEGHVAAGEAAEGFEARDERRGQHAQRVPGDPGYQEQYPNSSAPTPSVVEALDSGAIRAVISPAAPGTATITPATGRTRRDFLDPVASLMAFTAARRAGRAAAMTLVTAPIERDRPGGAGGADPRLRPRWPDPDPPERADRPAPRPRPDQEPVLPRAVRARVFVEAGPALTWYRLIGGTGRAGRLTGLDRWFALPLLGRCASRPRTKHAYFTRPVQVGILAA